MIHTLTILAIQAIAVPVSHTPDPYPNQEQVHLDIEGLTDLPLQAGAKLAVEVPYRLRVSSSLGFFPSKYLELINAVVVAAGGYDDSTAELIQGALENAMVWRTHLGWRPFRNLGLYFEAGYCLVVLGGGLSSEDLVSAVTGLPPPKSMSDRRQYHVTSTLHMVDVEVGWIFVFWKRLVLRAGLGFAGTVGATTTIEPEFRPLSAEASYLFTKAGENYLDDTYKSYVFTPVITLAIGYRVF